MSGCRISVVKVGGSLLARRDLGPQLQEWLRREMAARGPTHFVLIIGGGKFVDLVREFDQTFAISETCAHWISIDLMDVTARLVGALLPDVPIVGRLELLQERMQSPGATILRPSSFMHHMEPRAPGTRLAADWMVTSDSIAGRLAVIVGASEVVLIKAIRPPLEPAGQLGDWLENLAACDYVDGFLPQLARELQALRITTLSNDVR
jgi:aspartokinase-like uncharacterized kinase